jgi:hypothetical protein
LSQKLKNKPGYASQIEAIRLIRFNDLPLDVQEKLKSQGGKSNMVFSLDNRRLVAAKNHGGKINTRWATKEEIEAHATLRRFSTENAGKSACPR